MIQDNELIMLILGIGVLALTIIYKTEIKRIFGWKNLLSSYYLLLAASVFTVAEAFLWNFYLNLAEHLCYSASAVAFAVWCFRVSFSNKRIVY
ncbi:MAG: hypothetical protein H6Q21_1138 [Bacteroidetes bacterium]|jgi:hypothetical protein|nr:hypothetical protein [Bacteroidota bacterium]